MFTYKDMENKLTSIYQNEMIISLAHATLVKSYFIIFFSINSSDPWKWYKSQVRSAWINLQTIKKISNQY